MPLSFESGKDFFDKTLVICPYSDILLEHFFVTASCLLQANFQFT